MNCPNCGADLNHHKTLDGNTRPADGDLSVCAHCAGLSVFETGKLRPATRDDIEKLPPNIAFEIGQCQALAILRKESR